MAYCHKCGKQLKESTKFCGVCGAKTKDSSTPKKVVTRKHHTKRISFGFSVFSIFLILVVYLAMNLWAIGQVEIDTSASSIINSISNFNFNTGLLKTGLGTEIRIKNPTIIPVLISEVSYDLSYGDTVIGEGGTGFIFIMPKSYVDTSIDFELSHTNVGMVAIEGIINIFQKEKKSLGMDFYAGFGPIKVPVGELR